MTYPNYPIYQARKGAEAVQKAQAMGKPITVNMFSQPMIDGIRADFWLNYSSIETLEFDAKGNAIKTL